MVDGACKTVKPEELVDEDRLKELCRQPCGECGYKDTGSACPDSADDCQRHARFMEGARAALAELNISAIIPYTAGPCHRGFKKHPYDKCPDLEHAGCPYITMPGCFFQGGAVLVRKPKCREEARGQREHTAAKKDEA